MINLYIYVFNIIVQVYVHKFVNIRYILYISIYTFFYFSHEFSYSVFLCDLAVYFITVSKFWSQRKKIPVGSNLINGLNLELKYCRMGSTCIPVADSFWCLAKLIQCFRFKNKIKKNKKKKRNNYFLFRLDVTNGWLDHHRIKTVR